MLYNKLKELFKYLINKENLKLYFTNSEFLIKIKLTNI